jgi:hypothetical protein
MNKRLQKKACKFLLITFTFNTIIAPTIQAMAIPVAVAQQVPYFVQQIPRALLAAGSCIAGFVATQWATQKTASPATIKNKIIDVHKDPRICQSNTTNYPQGVSQARQDEVQLQEAEWSYAPHAIVEQQKTVAQQSQEHTEKQDLESLTSQQLENAKRQEEARAIDWLKHVTYKKIVFRDYTPDAMQHHQLPNGVEYANDSTSIAMYVIESHEQDPRIKSADAYAEYRWPFDRMLAFAKEYPQVRECLTEQLTTIVDCFSDIESSDLIDRIEGRFALSNLAILTPYDDNLNYIIDEIHQVFFHKDGTLCRAGIHQQTYANDCIIKLVNWFDKEMHSVIPRQKYISDQAYARLNHKSSWTAIASFFKKIFRSTGHKCPVGQLSSEQARTSNKALQECIDYCQDFDFASAKELLKHDNSGLMKDIIEYYQNVKRQEHAATYDNHGILRVAHNDPLYKQYKQQLEKLPKKQLEPVNENFLARHNVKNIMQEQWGISDAAPAYVHGALYTIMGADCSTLADITLLQKCIEQIIASAPADQHNELTKAFYNEYGILKEFNLQVKDISEKLHLSKQAHSFMRTPEATETRHQLNTLVRFRITNPEKATDINTAIEFLGRSLSATTEAERTDYKNKFDSLYLKLAEQPQQQKPNIAPQGDNNPTPDDQKPDPNKDKNGRYSGKLVKETNPRQDIDAEKLADKLKGQSRMKFSNDPYGKEFDVISDEYIAEAKPALKSIDHGFRKQAKEAFEAAKQTGRKVYYHFNGTPCRDVIKKLYEYAKRYGVEVVIDTEIL